MVRLRALTETKTKTDMFGLVRIISKTENSVMFGLVNFQSWIALIIL